VASSGQSRFSQFDNAEAPLFESVLQELSGSFAVSGSGRRS